MVLPGPIVFLTTCDSLIKSPINPTLKQKYNLRKIEIPCWSNLNLILKCKCQVLKATKYLGIACIKVYVNHFPIIVWPHKLKKSICRKSWIICNIWALNRFYMFWERLRKSQLIKRLDPCVIRRFIICLHLDKRWRNSTRRKRKSKTWRRFYARRCNISWQDMLFLMPKT